MPTNTNRAAGLRFRELCTILLQAAGLPATTPKGWRLPSEMFAAAQDETPKGDIELPGWIVLTTASATPGRLGEHVTRAERMATAAGAKHSAVLAWRKGAIGREHFAVMSVEGWADLVAEARSEAEQVSRTGADPEVEHVDT